MFIIIRQPREFKNQKNVMTFVNFISKTRNKCHFGWWNGHKNWCISNSLFKRDILMKQIQWIWFLIKIMELNWWKCPFYSMNLKYISFYVHFIILMQLFWFLNSIETALSLQIRYNFKITIKLYVFFVLLKVINSFFSSFSRRLINFYYFSGWYSLERQLF